MSSEKYLIHYNHNHDALGRFSKSSGARTRAAKRGLNKLYRLDKKANKYFAKSNSGSKVSRYYKHKYDGDFNPLAAKKRANRYAKKLEKKIGSTPVEGLNGKQLYAGRSYCMRFVR